MLKELISKCIEDAKVALSNNPHFKSITVEIADMPYSEVSELATERGKMLDIAGNNKAWLTLNENHIWFHIYSVPVKIKPPVFEEMETV